MGELFCDFYYLNRWRIALDRKEAEEKEAGEKEAGESCGWS